MWHEARKREKATQKLFNEYRKRGKRRREEEERINPATLLQVYGVKSKLSLDPDVYKQATKSLVPWQGDKNITIDRFDVRATLSSLKTFDIKSSRTIPKTSVIDADESDAMKKVLNYERYRILIQNELNKVPEEVRLKLVAKSDPGSEAKMRKLRYDRFGVPGETSIASNKNVHISSESRIGSATATKNQHHNANFSYNSVPPPSSLNDRNNRVKGALINTTDVSRLKSNFDNSTVIDLDDYDNLELDNIYHILKDFKDPKKLGEVTRKYNISIDELQFLVSRDHDEINIDDLLGEMIKLSHEKQDTSDEEKDKIYGPALPPDLDSIKNETKITSDDDSPVRQRSPSGADIPLRTNGNHDELPKKSPESDIINPHRYPEPETSEMKEKHDSVDKRKSKEYEPRRASTPLAYKRNCRSDRSISRERKSRHSRRKRSHKARSRSRS